MKTGAKKPAASLSRREREIMDIIYRRETATAAEILEDMPEPPSYSAVRAMLRVLEDKGHIRHGQDGPRYVFSATTPRDSARRSALRHLLATFFDGSAEDAVATLIDVSRPQLGKDELARLASLIAAARKEGR